MMVREMTKEECPSCGHSSFIRYGEDEVGMVDNGFGIADYIIERIQQRL